MANVREAASADKTRIVNALALLTLASRRRVLAMLNAAPPRATIRAAMRDLWPTSVDHLETLTVADVRDHGIVADVVGLVPRAPATLQTEIATRRGNTLLRTVLVDAARRTNRTTAARSMPQSPPNARSTVTTPSPSREAPRRLEPGRILADQFVLRRSIGSGGFGEAWEATPLGGRKRVVLKVSTQDHSRQSAEYDKLRDAAHRNVIKCLDLVEDRDFGKILVLQYGGPNLAQHLESRGGFDDEEVFKWVKEIAAALDHVHRLDIVHHDVSPFNIVVDARGKARLIDFGVSLEAERIARGAATRTLVAPQAIGRSGIFAAPEMLSLHDVGGRADQYSLALVALALLDGRIPDQQMRPGASSRLYEHQNKALLRGLSISPKARFPSCAAFARALTRPWP